MNSQVMDAPALIKQSVANEIRDRIICGEIAPGERIVEARWAARLRVAEGSIREALNLLAAQGFVRKQAGRSARVIRLTPEDVKQIYELRAVVEGLAGRLVTMHKPDISPMDTACSAMEDAIDSGDVKAVVEADLRFHLLLLELSSNHVLLEHGRRLLIPLFAFVLMRVQTRHQGTAPWREALILHKKILEFLRGDDPTLTEQVIVRLTPKFTTIDYGVWDEIPTWQTNAVRSKDTYKPG